MIINSLRDNPDTAELHCNIFNRDLLTCMCAFKAVNVNTSYDQFCTWYEGKNYSRENLNHLWDSGSCAPMALGKQILKAQIEDDHKILLENNIVTLFNPT